MGEFERVGSAAIEGRTSVLEQRNEFGVDGAENEQPARHGRRTQRQRVDDRLEMRIEVAQQLAAEVLELVETDDVTCFGEGADGVRQPRQCRGSRETLRVDFKRLECIGEGREDASRGRIRYLHVQRRAV